MDKLDQSLTICVAELALTISLLIVEATDCADDGLLTDSLGLPSD